MFFFYSWTLTEIIQYNESTIKKDRIKIVKITKQNIYFNDFFFFLVVSKNKEIYIYMTRV